MKIKRYDATNGWVLDYPEVSVSSIVVSNPLSASSSTFLRGDGQWATPSGTTFNGGTITNSLTISGSNNSILMSDGYYINKRFDMLENASPQYILLCASGQNNEVMGTIHINRSSSNYQAATLEIVVSARSNAAVQGAALRTLQVIQSGERYDLVTATYSGTQYIAVRYSGNVYPETVARFTGRMVSTGSASLLTVVGSSDVSSVNEFDGTTHSFLDVDTMHFRGNVGIGTDSPSAKLDVNGALFLKGRVFGDSDGTNTYLKSGTSGKIYFETNGGTRGGIDASGNFGLGTLSPSANLHITSSNPVLQLTDSDTSGNAYIDYQAGTSLKVHAGGDALTFVAGNAERMRVASNGNVGIGDTSPSYKLEVAGDMAVNKIFDRNNGSYYLDPTSTSVLYNIDIQNATTFRNDATLDHDGTGTTADSHGIIFTARAIDQDFTKELLMDSSGNLDFNGNALATESYVGTQIANLVDSSPDTLNTLNELAAALGDDANFSTTVTNSIATKMPLAGGTFTGNVRLESGSFASLILDRGTTGAGSVVQFENNNGLIGGIGAFGDDGLQFRTADGTQMVLDSNNRLGVGTDSPDQRLDVDGITRIYQSSQTALKTYSAQAGLQLVGYQSTSGSPYTKTSDIVANADGTVASEMRFFTKASGDSSATERFRIESNGDAQFNGALYGKSVNNAYSNLYRWGGIFFTWDSDTYGTNTHHSIRSTYGNTYGDDLTINSFHHLRVNIDANNNNTDARFEIGHNTTSTDNLLFVVHENGKVGIGTDTSPLSTLEVQSDDGLYITTATNAPTDGAQIRFSDHSSQSQFGFIRYKHANQTVETEPVNSEDGFIIGGSENNTVVSIQGSLNVDGQTNFEGQVEVDSGDLIVRSGTVSANSFRSVLRDNSLENQATNGNADIGINYYGYAGGTTQFRDLNIYDGKTNLIAQFDGSSGYVGIGTTSPSYGLDVRANDGQIRAYGTIAKVWAEASDSGQASLELKNTEGHFRFITDNGGYSIYDQTDSAERFAIDTSGNSTIRGNLTVTSAYPRIYLTDTDSDSDYSIINGNGTFSIYDDTNGVMRMQINSSGDTTFSSGAVVATDYMYAHANLLTKGNLYLNYDNNPAGADAYVYFGDDASDTAHWLRFDNSAQQFGFSNRVVGTAGRLGAIESNGSDVDKVNFQLSGTTLTITTS